MSAAGNVNLCGNTPQGLAVYGRYWYTSVWEKLACTCCSSNDFFLVSPHN